MHIERFTMKLRPKSIASGQNNANFIKATLVIDCTNCVICFGFSDVTKYSTNVMKYLDKINASSDSCCL